MKPNAFTKREHLRAKRDFDAAYRERRSARDGRLVVYVRPNGLGWSRLGLSVSGRLGNSVRRNRFRRICREAFRLHKHEIPKGCDFIVIPVGGLDQSLSDVSESLLNLTKKLCQASA